MTNDGEQDPKATVDTVGEHTSGPCARCGRSLLGWRRDTMCLGCITHLAADAKSQRFAAEAHAGQHYGREPYTAHLEAVHELLASAPRGEVGDAALVAAWLHDTLEDTDTTRERIASYFGTDVARIVDAVTGDEPTRAASMEAVYTKIAALPSDLAHDAASLKVADRTANVRASARTSPVKLAMYHAESRRFAEALAGLGAPYLWAQLFDALTTRPPRLLTATEAAHLAHRERVDALPSVVIVAELMRGGAPVRVLLSGPDPHTSSASESWYWRIIDKRARRQHAGQLSGEHGTKASAEERAWASLAQMFGPIVSWKHTGGAS